MPQPLPPSQNPERVIARVITLNGIQMGLLAAKPNWTTEIKVTLELPTDVSKQAITFAESRRNFAQSVRYHMEWTSYMPDAAASTELRIFLNRVRELPILVPLWPDVCELATNIVRGQRVFNLVDLPARSGSSWIIANDDFSVWDIVGVSSLNLTTQQMTLAIGANNPYPAGTRIYPLMSGRLEERPKPESITDETADVAFKLKENVSFLGRVTPISSPIQLVGPNIPTFAALPKWTVIPNHSRPTDWTEMPDILYESVGFLREDQQRVYDHGTPRGQELEFYQSDRGSVGQIEWFWRDRRATTLRFMIPTFRGDLRMLANTPVPGQPTWIRCERSEFSDVARVPQTGYPYIALINRNNVVIPYALSSAIDVVPDETRLVVTTNVETFNAQNTIVSHLLLARFVDPKLEWTYTTPYLATTRIKFQDLPQEYPNSIVPVPPPPLPEPAFLFIFTEVGIRVDRFTSYENTVLISTGTYAGSYAPAPFSFDTVKCGLKLDQEKLDLKSFKFPGNPLNKLWPFALDGIMTLEIVEVSLNPTDPTRPASNPISRFYGDVWSVDSDYKATIIPFGNLFDRKFPRFLLQVSDNYVQFSPPTRITATAFVINDGHIHDPNLINHVSQTLIVTSPNARAKITLGLGYPSTSGGPDDYFAGGWLEVGVNPSAAFESRAILASSLTVGSATDVTLSLDRPLLKASTGQAIRLYPGYDGGIDRCDGKFFNRINFGGHAYVPDVNPGVNAIVPTQTQGGKKGQA